MKSKVSCERIQSKLQGHSYFAKPEAADLSSWRAMWSAFELSPSDQDLALARFEADFDARAFHEVGEIYHLFGLALWLSSLGFPGWESEGLEAKLKRYVDDAYARCEPTTSEVTQETSLDLMMGAYGFAFKRSDDPLFMTVVRYEEDRRTTWRKRGYPEIAANLRDMASRDGEQFLRVVCFTNGGPATFAKIGVLKSY